MIQQDPTIYEVAEKAGYIVLGMIGGLGLAIIIVCVSIITYKEWRVRHDNKIAEARGHNTRDAACMFWWGDRRGSITARCPICNPARENARG